MHRLDVAVQVVPPVRSVPTMLTTPHFPRGSLLGAFFIITIFPLRVLTRRRSAPDRTILCSLINGKQRLDGKVWVLSLDTTNVSGTLHRQWDHHSSGNPQKPETTALPNSSSNNANCSDFAGKAYRPGVHNDAPFDCPNSSIPNEQLSCPPVLCVFDSVV